MMKRRKLIAARYQLKISAQKALNYKIASECKRAGLALSASQITLEVAFGATSPASDLINQNERHCINV